MGWAGITCQIQIAGLEGSGLNASGWWVLVCGGVFEQSTHAHGHDAV